MPSSHEARRELSCSAEVSCLRKWHVVKSIAMIDSLFSIPLKCFTFIGFRRNTSEKFSKFYHMLHIISLSFMIFTVSSECLYTVLNFKDIMASAEGFGCFSSELLSVAKFVTFYIGEKKFFTLIEKVKKLSAKGN